MTQRRPNAGRACRRRFFPAARGGAVRRPGHVAGAVPIRWEFNHVDAIDATPPKTQAAAAAHRCDPAAEARKKRALRKARKAAAAVARLNKRRAEKLGKEPASRKGTAASGRANFSRNLSRKLALNLSPPAPAARVSEQPLKRVTWSAAPGSRRPMALARVVGGPGASSWVAAGFEGAVRGAGLHPSGGSGRLAQWF